MADLESALHYILRVEVGKFSVLEGQRLAALKKFVAVLAKVSWVGPTWGECTGPSHAQVRPGQPQARAGGGEPLLAQCDCGSTCLAGPFLSLRAPCPSQVIGEAGARAFPHSMLSEVPCFPCRLLADPP